ncbi:hypothetical protein K437DRAFT_270146 [Tilletiaria anomala UBC 951]|uniref:Uncharacterized protein n=1 Tax=Tilletiaria anomala (strain ATCC 24038 / CBS 436.72 / UBC 951) TaxID=1037660 RepID=A0A066VHZ3_TILAU|nr:uncharacterized protein K437DRAFT_270146 [Tilletiaria anomala UBC 951]KDN39923.1 hypothetical protein K437DRAFT_270146 [Tilletiaria anomala UBC 951]
MFVPAHALGESGFKVTPGAMALTWAPDIAPVAQPFNAFNATLEGSYKLMTNVGTFYTADSIHNLALPKCYLEKVSHGNIELVVLSLKGGFELFKNLSSLDSSVENLREELQAAEATFEALAEEVPSNHTGLLEVNAKTIREIHAVVHVAVVQVEYNQLSLEIEWNGVMATCKERRNVLVRPATARRLTLAHAYERLIVISSSTKAATVKSNGEAAKVHPDQQTFDKLRTLVDEVEKLSGTRYPAAAMG